MEYQDHLAAVRAADPALAGELAGLVGLEGVMRWMAQRGIPLAKAEIIAQDEFSLDFVVPLGEGGRHLAFGIT